MNILGLIYLSGELAFGIMLCRLMIQGGQTLWQARNGMMICLFLMILFSSILSQCELLELLSIDKSYYGSLVDSCFPKSSNSRLGSGRMAIGISNALFLGELFVCIYLIIKRKSDRWGRD